MSWLASRSSTGVSREWHCYRCSRTVDQQAFERACFPVGYTTSVFCTQRNAWKTHLVDMFLGSVHQACVVRSDEMADGGSCLVVDGGCPSHLTDFTVSRWGVAPPMRPTIVVPSGAQDNVVINVSSDSDVPTDRQGPLSNLPSEVSDLESMDSD